MSDIGCPHCGMLLSSGDLAPGELVACPGCHGQFQMPMLQDSPGVMANTSAMPAVENLSIHPVPRSRPKRSSSGAWLLLLVLAPIAFLGPVCLIGNVSPSDFLPRRPYRPYSATRVVTADTAAPTWTTDAWENAETRTQRSVPPREIPLPRQGTSFPHDDGQGVTIVQGNKRLVTRYNPDGTVQNDLYVYDGDWTYRFSNDGRSMAWYSDRARGVTRFDSRNPNQGYRKYGEYPYPGNWTATPWQYVEPYSEP